MKTVDWFHKYISMSIDDRYVYENYFASKEQKIIIMDYSRMVEVLKIMSKSAKEQVLYFPSCLCSAEELALEFNNEGYEIAQKLRINGYLDDEVMTLIDSINCELNMIDRERYISHNNDIEFLNSPPWIKIREIASIIIKKLE